MSRNVADAYCIVNTNRKERKKKRFFSLAISHKTRFIQRNALRKCYCHEKKYRLTVSYRIWHVLVGMACVSNMGNSNLEKAGTSESREIIIQRAILSYALYNQYQFEKNHTTARLKFFPKSPLSDIYDFS